MTDKFSIAIASDIHIGEAGREFDLRPNGAPAFPNQPSYIQKFQEFIGTENLEADFLVVPGDLSNKAQPEEFKHAEQVLKDIAQALKVDHKNIIAVPGNHDLNWDVCNLDVDGIPIFWEEYRFVPAETASEFVLDVFSDGEESLLRPPYVVTKSRGGVAFVCFNSAAYDFPRNKPHNGRVLSSDLQAVEDAIKAAKKSHSTVIFIIHHHPIQYSELYGDIADYSILVNAQNLLKILDQYQVDFVIHGHKHKPNFQIHTVDMSHPLPVFAAGSFGVTLPASYSGAVTNQFHRITFEGCSVSNGLQNGFVESWAFAGPAGWQKSRLKHNGIDRVCPFGWYADRAEINRKLEPALATLLQTSAYIRWEEFCNSNPKFEKLSGYAVWNALKALSGKLKFHLHGEENSLADLLILKGS